MGRARLGLLVMSFMACGPPPAAPSPVIPPQPSAVTQPAGPVTEPVTEPAPPPAKEIEMPALHARGAIAVMRYVPAHIDLPEGGPLPATAADKQAEKKLQKELAARRKTLDKDIAKLERTWKKTKKFEAGLAIARAYGERAKASATNSEAEKTHEKAVNVYAALRADAANATHADYEDMLFEYASTLQQTGADAKAREVYFELIKAFPNSAHLTEIYLAFADHYFAANQMAEAAQFYDKVLSDTKSNVYVYALYKRAWVHMNNQDSVSALELFFKVVNMTVGSAKPGHEALHRSAKKDFVLAYAEVGKAEVAHKAFQRVDKNAAFDMLMWLGDMYDTQGKFEKAVFIRRALIELDPKHPHVCRFQIQVVEAMARIGKHADTAREMANLGTLHRVYADSAALPADELAYCGARTEQLLATVSREVHQEIQKTLDASTAVHVVDMYDAYLAAFPAGPEAQRAAYYRADVLWRIAAAQTSPRAGLVKWHEAAQAFATHAMHATSGPDHAEVIAGALLGYANAFAIAKAVGMWPATLRKEGAAVAGWVIANHPDHANAAIANQLQAEAP